MVNTLGIIQWEEPHALEDSINHVLRFEFVHLAMAEGANIRQLCRRFDVSARGQPISGSNASGLKLFLTIAPFGRPGRGRPQTERGPQGSESRRLHVSSFHVPCGANETHSEA
jgi:hypothetical protein